MIDGNNIKQFLKKGYEKEFFEECIKNLSNKDSRIRLSNFAYSLRELVREVLADRAPDGRIKRCCWYVPHLDENGKEVITREQRMKYAIQGGLLNCIVKDDLRILVDETTKEVKKQIDRLSKYTHITKEVFYTDEDINTLAEEPLNAVETLFYTIADAKSKFGEAVCDLINQEIFDTFLYETINEIDCLSTHHHIRYFQLGSVTVSDISDDGILFEATGRVYVHLQYGSDSDLRNDIGYEMDADYPFEATLSAPIPQSLDELSLSMNDFEVDTDDFYDYEKEVLIEE